MRIVSINDIEPRTESDTEVESVLGWLTAGAEVAGPSAHSGLRPLEWPVADEKKPEEVEAVK